MPKHSIETIQKFKDNNTHFATLTAYDYTSAKIVDNCGIPLILVGDSASMVMYGYETTIPVTMDEMLIVVSAVSRGAKNSLVVADMPFMSYQESPELALKNAGLFIKKSGAGAIKLEGGEEVSHIISSITSIGIPVMAHIGLTPQSFHQMSGYKIQGKSKEAAEKILLDAKSVEKAGAFAVVLEGIPAELSKKITDSISIPTIGIGSGVNCDGEIQVFHDVFGLYNDFTPKHTKRFVNLAENLTTAVKSYKEEVECRAFPGVGQSVSMDAEAINKIRAQLDHENNNPAKAIAVV